MYPVHYVSHGLECVCLSAIDLHMTSTAGHLARTSPRLGSRSPSDMSSSPSLLYAAVSSNSAHSHSASAIFERDIEPTLLVPRIARTDQLDMALPSVLDSAASLLAAADVDHIAVLTPVAVDGMASPIGSLRSRSPSPSPPHPPANRLSFISYSDLLSSTPASTLPLASLTTSPDPPPHIPALVATPASPSARSPATSLRGLARDTLLDDLGGEWEREGLGTGLEERLEALIAIPHPQKHV